MADGLIDRATAVLLMLMINFVASSVLCRDKGGEREGKDELDDRAGGASPELEPREADIGKRSLDTLTRTSIGASRRKP